MSYDDGCENVHGGLCLLPTLAFQQHVLPRLTPNDLRSLRLVNRQFAELYRMFATSLTIRICREALDALRHPEGPSSGNTAPTNFSALYPSVCHVSLTCDPHPLTPLRGGMDVARLLQLLGPHPAQTSLTLHDPIHIPLSEAASKCSIGGGDQGATNRVSEDTQAPHACIRRDASHAEPEPPSPATSDITTRAISVQLDQSAAGGIRSIVTRSVCPGAADSETDGEAGDNEAAAAAVARALASMLPNLQGLRLVSNMQGDHVAICRSSGGGRHTLATGGRGGGSSNGSGDKGPSSGSPGRGEPAPHAAVQSPAAGQRCAPGRPMIALQPVLSRLAKELMTSAEAGCGGPGGGDSGAEGTASGEADAVCTTGAWVLDPHGLTQSASATAAVGIAGGGGPPTAAAQGLQSLTCDAWQRSVDPFEAELLDLHLPYMSEVLLDFRAVAAAASAAAASAAAAAVAATASPTAVAAVHPVVRLPRSLRARSSAPSHHPLSHPLLRLTSLELRGVAVHPALLVGLRELRLLTRLVLSVSCPRPHEPLVTALPCLKLLRCLHLFLHVPPPPLAQSQQLQELQPRRQPSAPWQQGPRTAAAPRAEGRKCSPGGAALCYWEAEGRGWCGGGSDRAPDCTASQLAAAVSQCGRLVSLALPGEELDQNVAMLLQALPGLTHLEARQLGAWDLAGPHTALQSLTLTMAWPNHVAALLPSLPRLGTLRADMFLHAEGGSGSGGGGCSSSGGRGREADGRRVRGREQRRRGSLRAAGRDGDGEGGVSDLYEQLAALAAALEGVRHVELQLSVMRPEPWEWSLVLREVAAVRGLRALTLRMPQRDSGPPLRNVHLVTICRCMRELRRLTLLLARGGCSRVGYKALEALRHLPRLELVQLHLGGAWDGGQAEGIAAPGVGQEAGSSGGGRDARKASQYASRRLRDGPLEVDGTEGSGVDAVAGCRDERRRSRRQKQQRSSRIAAGGRFNGGSLKDDSGEECLNHDGAADGGSAEGGAELAWADGTERGESAAAQIAPQQLQPPLSPPPLPDSSAARAVLEAARGLGGGGGGDRGRRAEASSSSSSSSTRSSSSTSGDGDSEGTAPDSDDDGGCSAWEGDVGELTEGSHRTAGSAIVADATVYGSDHVECLHPIRHRHHRHHAGAVGNGGESDEDDSDAADGDSIRRRVFAAARSGCPSFSGGWSDGKGREPGKGRAGRRLRPTVRMQVDFLDGSQVAEVNAVLRWEGRSVVLRSGLEPRWVWAEAAGLSG